MHSILNFINKLKTLHSLILKVHSINLGNESPPVHVGGDLSRWMLIFNVSNFFHILKLFLKRQRFGLLDLNI